MKKIKNVLIWCALLSLSAQMVIFTGCAFRKKEISKTGEITSQSELVKILETKQETSIDNVKIFGKGEINAKEGKKKFKIAILLKRPGYHNIQILSPFGNPVATIVGDMEKSYLTDFRNSRVILSTPPEKIMERITGFSGRISGFIDFVTGRMPVDFEKRKSYSVDISGDKYFYRLTVYDFENRRLEYFIDRKMLTPARVEIYGKGGDSPSVITYKGAVGDDRGLEFPLSVNFMNSSGIETFSLVIKEISVNNELTSEKFEFRNPMNFKIKEVE